MATPTTDPVLTRYFALAEDLVTLAAETGQSIPALLDWLHSREIARTVARFRAHQAHLLTAFALNALAKVVAATPDLIEKRRAATTILRAATGPRNPHRPTRPPALDPWDHTSDRLDDTLDDDAEDLIEDSADSDDLDDLTDTAVPDRQTNINALGANPAAAQVSAQHQSSSATPAAPKHHHPDHTQVGPHQSGTAAAPPHATSARGTSTATAPQLTAPNSAPVTPDDEAAEMAAHDNRYADYYLPPIPQCNGPPR